MNPGYPFIEPIDRPAEDGDRYFDTLRLFEPSYLALGVVVKLLQNPASRFAYVTIADNPGQFM